MPNPYLSGRIPVELDKQIDKFLARTGETRTQMLIRAVAAYIGAEVPNSKEAGDRRLENLEQEVAELKGAVKSLYEKLATFTPKTESLEIEIEPVTTSDNIIDNNDNKAEFERANTVDNFTDNTDNKAEFSPLIDITPTIDDGKTFLNIETAELARRTKLPPKKFTSLRHSFNEKLKKENQSFPEKKKLDSPIKMTPASGIKIEKVPYDIFYVGHSEEGRNLWNLVPINTFDQPVQLSLVADNN